MLRSFSSKLIKSIPSYVNIVIHLFKVEKKSVPNKSRRR